MDDNQLTITIPIDEYRYLLETQIKSENILTGINGLYERLNRIEQLINGLNSNMYTAVNTLKDIKDR